MACAPISPIAINRYNSSRCGRFLNAQPTIRIDLSGGPRVARKYSNWIIAFWIKPAAGLPWFRSTQLVVCLFLSIKPNQNAVGDPKKYSTALTLFAASDITGIIIQRWQRQKKSFDWPLDWPSFLSFRHSLMIHDFSCIFHLCHVLCVSQRYASTLISVQLICRSVCDSLCENNSYRITRTNSAFAVKCGFHSPNSTSSSGVPNVDGPNSHDVIMWQVKHWVVVLLHLITDERHLLHDQKLSPKRPAVGTNANVYIELNLELFEIYTTMIRFSVLCVHAQVERIK